MSSRSLATIHLRDSIQIQSACPWVSRSSLPSRGWAAAVVRGRHDGGAFIRRFLRRTRGIDIRYLHEAKGAHSSIYLSILRLNRRRYAGRHVGHAHRPAGSAGDYLPSQKQLIQGAKVVTCDPCMGETALLTAAGPVPLRLADRVRRPGLLRVCASSRRSSAGSTLAKPNRMELRSWPGWRSVPTPICSVRAKWS